MADKSEEVTLDAYAKQSKKFENKGDNKQNNGKRRIEKKMNGIKKAKSAIRRTGGNFDNKRSGGKPRQNNSGSNQRNNSRPPKEFRTIQTKTVRPIPEHKKRIVKVYNLIPTINNEEFYNLFVKYGSIEQSKIETDKKGKSEEKGYVVYRDNDAAQRAIDDLHGVELEGRFITVEFMKDGEKLPERTSSSNKSGSGEERERRSSDTAPGVQKNRIFKRKDDRFERRDSFNSNRRDNNNRGGQRRSFDGDNRRGNGNNRNRNNNNNRNNNRNRKFSR